MSHLGIDVPESRPFLIIESDIVYDILVGCTGWLYQELMFPNSMINNTHWISIGSWSGLWSL